MKDTGGPAFPVPLNPHESFDEMGAADGMTLRDYFAAKAMTGMLACADRIDRSNAIPAGYARCAYEFADAMLKERAQ